MQPMIKNRLKPNKAFYQWCLSQFPKYDFKVKGEIVKSYKENKNNRKRKTIERMIRSNTNFEKMYKEKIFVIVLATKKRIEIQSYIFWQSINSETLEESLNHKLWNIEIFKDNKHYTFGLSWFDLEKYTEGLTSNSSMTGPYSFIEHYPQDYREVFKHSELRHFDMNELFVVQRVPRIYKYRHGLEHLQRKNNKKLFNNVISGVADMRRLTKSFVRNHDRLIREDFSYDNILAYEMIKHHESGAKPNIKAVEYFSQSKSLLEKHLDRPQFNRLQNYLFKQKQYLRYYDDYLNMLREVGNETEDDIVIFPKNLVEEHDKLVQVIIILNAERKLKLEVEEAIKLEEITNKLKLFEYQGDKYQVVAPESLKDITNEGAELKHCVGGSYYLNEHKKGKANIMFIRRKDERDKPFYTMTYVDQKTKVTQIHGYGNDETKEDPLIKDFVENEWLPYVSRVKERNKMSC